MKKSKMDMPAKPKKKSKGGLVVLVIVLAMILIGGFAAAGYFLYENGFIGGSIYKDDSKESKKTEDDDKKNSNKEKEDKDTKEKEKDDKDADKQTTVTADDVTFKHEYGDNSENFVLIAKDKNGDELWRYESPDYDLTELDQCVNLGKNKDLYMVVDGGIVKAFDLATGDVVFAVTGYNVCPSTNAFAFDTEGNLYVSGYYGPDLLAVSYEGEILNYTETFSQDYWWPYKVTLDGDSISIDFFGSFDDMGGTVVVNKDDFTYSVGSGNYARITSVVTSSVLDNDNYFYGSSNLIDGDLATAWVEGAAGNGEGETVRFFFDHYTDVSMMEIYNGYQKSEDIYYKNCRATCLDLSFSDGTSERVYLSDTGLGMQTVRFTSHNTNYVDIKIVRVADGSAYEDTCISEVAFK